MRYVRHPRENLSLHTDFYRVWTFEYCRPEVLRSEFRNQYSRRMQRGLLEIHGLDAGMKRKLVTFIDNIYFGLFCFQCSRSCGYGVQTRSVVCFFNNSVVHDEYCNTKTKANLHETTHVCSIEPCQPYTATEVAIVSNYK